MRLLNDYRTALSLVRWALLAAIYSVPFVGMGQTATDLCGLTAGARYPVGTSCVYSTFNKPVAFTSSMNAGSCGSGPYDDAWGWFTATSAYTTVQYVGNQDAILHVYTGTCASPQYVACSDIMGAALPEAVTIPTVIGQDYFVRIERYNTNNAMNGNLCVFSTDPTVSCGTTVYDSGGPSGNYSNNERRFITYCPPAPGQAVTLNFTSFSLGSGDNIAVFSGAGSGGTFLGQFTGGTLPPTLTSTDPSGCITLVFFSNGSGVSSGWAANVVCNPAPDCIYVLNLYDSWGDGWGSSAVGYSINGGPYQYWTITQSAGQVLIPVNVGDVFILNYLNTGGWQSENSFTLSILGQSGLYSSGPPPIPGIQFPHVVDCIAPAAPPEDCIGSTTICSNQAFNANTTSTGFVADLSGTNRGCLGSNERQGTWYTFSPTNAGTVAFTISPSNPSDDYDFAIWGPYPPGSTTANVCPPSSPPIRCSYAAPAGDTGLNFSASDLTEDPYGDKWVRFITASPDQVFLLYISNWSQSGLAFSLNFNPSMTADLDCAVLPVEMGTIMATPQDRYVNVDWTTMSQRDVARFIVERSADGRSFAPLGSMDAGGDSFGRKDYRYVDSAPIQGMNFYRLITVGTDGHEEVSNVVSARMGVKEPVLVPNPLSGQAVLHTGTAAAAGSVLRITDASGRTVQEAVITNEGMVHNVDMGGLSNGVYVLFLYTADGAPLGHSRFVKE